jgi:hypothetical protein
MKNATSPIALQGRDGKKRDNAKLVCQAAAVGRPSSGNGRTWKRAIGTTSGQHCFSTKAGVVPNKKRSQRTTAECAV